MTHEMDSYRYTIHGNGLPVLDYSKDKPLYPDKDEFVVTVERNGECREGLEVDGGIDDLEKEKLLTDLQVDAQRIMDAYGIPREFVGEAATFHHPEPPPRYIPGVDLTPEPEKTIDLKYDEDQDAYRE